MEHGKLTVNNYCIDGISLRYSEILKRIVSCTLILLDNRDYYMVYHGKDAAGIVISYGWCWFDTESRQLYANMLSLSSLDGESSHNWALKETLLSAVCFLPMLTFAKLPFDQYLGSGWTVLCAVLASLFVLAPLCHLQFRLGYCHRAGLLTLQARELPFTLGIAVMITNLIKVILSAVFLTFCIAYFIFLIYRCDGKHCIGAYYMWGSCRDIWSEGDCKDGYLLVYAGPTAEEKFMINYVQMRTDGLDSFGGFPFWSIIPGGMFIPYALAWLSIFLITFGGHRLLAIWIYGLAPITVALLIGVATSMGVMYADSVNQLSAVAARFYTQFSAIVPVDQYARDQFVVRPLVWGFLSTFVHLSQAMNLWTGVFPILGMWNRGHGHSKHVSLVVVVLAAVFLMVIPVLMVVFASASAFDMTYLRCHLGTDWLIPFVLVAHVFSKFSTHRLLAGAFFLSLFLCILLYSGLLLVSTISNISDSLKRMSPRDEITSRKKTYRIAFFLLFPVLIAVGLPMISRSCFYWIRLIDWFVDRLLVVSVLLQAINFLVIFRRMRRGRRESATLKTIAMALYGIIVGISLVLTFFIDQPVILSLLVYLWYAVVAAQPAPDSGCLTYSAAPKNDPLVNKYRFAGWAIAVAPLLFGAIFFTVRTVARSWRINKSFFYTCVTGEASVCRVRLKNPGRYSYDPIHQFEDNLNIGHADQVDEPNSIAWRGHMWH